MHKVPSLDGAGGLVYFGVIVFGVRCGQWWALWLGWLILVFNVTTSGSDKALSNWAHLLGGALKV